MHRQGHKNDLNHNGALITLHKTTNLDKVGLHTAFGQNGTGLSLTIPTTRYNMVEFVSKLVSLPCTAQNLK